MKVSDEFVVPLCRLHHREVHHAGNELTWWNEFKTDPIETARKLWQQSHKSVTSPELDSAETNKSCESDQSTNH